jgi:hypothetical protein
MIVLDAINLNRQYGRLVLDRPPRTEIEFHVLAVMLKGVDQLLAGEEPDAEFTENFLTHPAVQEAILRYAPVGAKVQ